MFGWHFHRRCMNEPLDCCILNNRNEFVKLRIYFFLSMTKNGASYNMFIMSQFFMYVCRFLLRICTDFLNSRILLFLSQVLMMKSQENQGQPPNFVRNIFHILGTYNYSIYSIYVPKSSCYATELMECRTPQQLGVGG